MQTTKETVILVEDGDRARIELEAITIKIGERVVIELNGDGPDTLFEVRQAGARTRLVIERDLDESNGIIIRSMSDTHKSEIHFPDNGVDVERRIEGPFTLYAHTEEN